MADEGTADVPADGIPNRLRKRARAKDSGNDVPQKAILPAKKKKPVSIDPKQTHLMAWLGQANANASFPAVAKEVKNQVEDQTRNEGPKDDASATEPQKRAGKQTRSDKKRVQKKPLKKKAATAAISTDDEVLDKCKDDSNDIVEDIRPFFSIHFAGNTSTGGRDENQDSYLLDNQFDRSTVLESLSRSSQIIDVGTSVAIFGVFDGHGPCGKEAAQMAEKMCSPTIKSCLPDRHSYTYTQAEVKQAIREGLSQLQTALIDFATKQESESQEFGTTAIITVFWGGNRITIANVGDSRAVLFRESGSKFSRRQINRQVFPLSVDHTLTRPDEQERIGKTQGRIVIGKAGCRRLLPNLPKKEVVVKKLGLAMGRSLGHLILRDFGVTWEPEFYTTVVQENDILIMASDGLWDLYSNNDLEIRLRKSSEPEDILKKLFIDHTKDSKDKNISSDNTTIVCVKFVDGIERKIRAKRQSVRMVVSTLPVYGSPDDNTKDLEELDTAFDAVQQPDTPTCTTPTPTNGTSNPSDSELRREKTEPIFNPDLKRCDSGLHIRKTSTIMINS